MTEKELVKICLTEICRKNGISETSMMVQRDFEHISQSIDENTGVLISLSTIKRLLNGEFSRTPQIATLNAIAAYLGFKSWREYKSSMKNDIDYILPEPRLEEEILIVTYIRLCSLQLKQANRSISYTSIHLHSE